MDFETKRQKVLAYIKGLKTMPVVVAKELAPEPVAVIDGVAYFHKQEFDLEELLLMSSASLNLLDGGSVPEGNSLIEVDNVGPGADYHAVILRLRRTAAYRFFLAGGSAVTIEFTSRAFTIVETQEEVTDNTKICLPTCSAYYGFLSEDGKTFISYYNLKDDGAPTETIIVPVYDQNGVDPTKIEALKAIAAGGKVGEALLDELVDYIDNPSGPVIDDKIHAFLTVPADSLTAKFDCGTLIDGAEAKVDWGDGTVEDLTAKARMTHTYTDAGDYEVKISGMATFNEGYYPGMKSFFSEHLRKVVLSNTISAIATYAFYSCKKLISITISDSVTSIGSSVFGGCTSLMSVNIGFGVTSIGGQTFSGCTGLTSITIPNNVTSIGSNIFQNCTSLMSVVIGSGVTIISQGAFSGCTSLTSITIPNGVTRIDTSAFQNCSGLESVNIGSGVTTINQSAFQGCTSLTSIIIPHGVTSIANMAFRNCTSLTSITIPDSVTSIGQAVFSGCTSLTSISIPNSITRIAETTFSGCTGLTSVTIPDSVTNISNQAFYNCSGLISVNIGSGVTSISSDAFEYCTGLMTITVDPNNQTYYSEGNCLIHTSDNVLALGCKTSVISNDVTGIGQNAFFGCTGLTSITIPDSVTMIDTCAFLKCTGLTSITIPDSITKIGDSAFQDCTGLTSITIPDSVTTIYNGIFRNCTGLTSVNIGSGVTNISSETFNGCTSLASISIPNNIDGIGSNSFKNCFSLSEIIFEKGRESVPTLSNINAFDGLPEGYRIYVQYDLLSAWKAALNWSSIADRIEDLPWADGHIHGAVSITTAGQSVTFIPGTFIVNTEHKIDWGDGTVEDLTADTSISHTYATVGEYDFTIKGTRTLANNAFNGCTSLTYIAIPDNVTEIGAWAFQNCSGLESVNIGSGVTKMLQAAFDNCTSLASIIVDPNNRTYYSEGNCLIKSSNKSLELGCKTSVIPNGVIIIGLGGKAFSGCTGLKSITIPDSVTTISSSAFTGCTGLTYVNIGSGVTSIEGYAFSDCTSLTYIAIPNNVTSIKGTAFQGCTGLMTIVVDPNNQTYYSEGNCLIRSSDKVLILGCKTSVIPNNVTGIGDSAFWEQTNITSITIPDSVTSIGMSAFRDCVGLTSVHIGSGVTKIDNGAFYSCTSLASITIPNNVTSIGNNVFDGCTALSNVTFEDGRDGVPNLSSSNAFKNNASGRKFYVQSDLLDAWKAATNWATYAADIEALPAA